MSPMSICRRLSLLVGAALVANCNGQDLAWPGAVRVAVPHDYLLYDPSWSPDGNYIAVGSQDAFEPEGRLLVADINSGEYSILDEAYSYDPGWSPDGSKILYYGQSYGLGIIDLSGAQAGTPITGGAVGAWSPDGTSIVVGTMAWDKKREGPKLEIVDLQGKVIASLWSAPYLEDEYMFFGGVAWSASSNQIVVSFGRLESGVPADNRDVFVIDPAGTDPTTIVATSADEFDPSWSPDGQWLVFISRNRQQPVTEETYSIMFAKADGSCLVPAFKSKRLTGLDWSPDGESLAVTTYNELYVVDIAKSFGEEYTDLDALCSS
jgi:TolB protein